MGMIGVILGLALDLVGLQTNNIVLIVIALLPLFFFFGSLVVSDNTLVGLLLNSHNRAKIYAIPILIFAITSVIILDLTAFLRDTFQQERTQSLYKY